MAQYLNRRGDDVYRMETEMIDVSSWGSSEPDPKWGYVDKAGHEHYVMTTSSEGKTHYHYPTLEWKHEEYWCAEDCGDWHTESWQVCRFCGETITPRTIPHGPEKRYTPGMQYYYKNDKEISKEEFERGISDHT